MITILSHDFYYKQHDELSLAERRELNYDHPDAFDTELMIRHIKALKNWQPVDRPVYDFTIYNRLPETARVMPARVVVVEGILIFETVSYTHLFISFRVLISRIKAIKSMMRDKTVPRRKKALVVLGIIYLLLPVDLIPPGLFPFGFLDDLVLWLWIIWNLKDTLDLYWDGEKPQDFSKAFAEEDIGEGVEFTVDQEDEKHGR